MTAVYMAGRDAMLRGQVDFMADTIKVALVGDDFTFDDTDETLSDVTVLAVDHVVLSPTAVTNGRVTVEDVTFPSVTGADIGGLVVYKDTGDPATSTLIAAIDGRADTVPLDITPNGGDIVFSFNYLVKI